MEDKKITRRKYDRDSTILFFVGFILGVALLGLIEFARSELLPFTIDCHNRFMVAITQNPDVANHIIEYYKETYNTACWIK